MSVRENAVAIEALAKQGSETSAAVKQLLAMAQQVPTATPPTSPQVAVPLAMGGVEPVSVQVPAAEPPAPIAPAPVASPSATPMTGQGSIFTATAECLEVYQAENGQHRVRIDIPINLASKHLSASKKSFTAGSFSGLTADGLIRAAGTISLPIPK